jgi:thiol-disulfide isomerase/thioredoxin
MDTPDESAGTSDAHEATSVPEPETRSTPSRRGRRALGPRTVAICVCIAAIGAIAAGLVATLVLDGDDGPVADQAPTGTLVRAGEVDRDELLEVELVTVDDDDTTLAEFLGEEPMVVNLWSQTCPPCIEEMPWLEETSQDNPDVTFLGVNVLDRPDRAAAMARQTGITYDWVRDPAGDFANAAKSTGLPDTLLLDTDGTILASKLGPFADQADIQRWLDDHLDP